MNEIDDNDDNETIDNSYKPEIEEAVLRGVELLDERDPLWWNGVDAPAVIEGMVGHIDLNNLDMQSQLQCVLGQRNRRGYYDEGLRALYLGHASSRQFGFNLGDDRDSSEWSYLTELWVIVIRSRRAPRKAQATFGAFAQRANKDWTPAKAKARASVRIASHDLEAP